MNRELEPNLIQHPVLVVSQVHATRQAMMSDHERPARDLKRQCRGLGMAGKAHFTPSHPTEVREYS